MEIPMSKPEFEKVLIKEGFYQGTLKEVKEISAGKWGDRLALVFDVQTDEGIVELARVVYKKLTPDTEFMKVLSIFGYEWKEGDKFETDKLIGKKATVVVESYDYEEGDNTKQASTISKVKLAEDVEEEAVTE